VLCHLTDRGVLKFKDNEENLVLGGVVKEMYYDPKNYPNERKYIFFRFKDEPTTVVKINVTRIQVVDQEPRLKQRIKSAVSCALKKKKFDSNMIFEK
jgi:hypothetical protein